MDTVTEGRKIRYREEGEVASRRYCCCWFKNYSRSVPVDFWPLWPCPLYPKSIISRFYCIRKQNIPCISPHNCSWSIKNYLFSISTPYILYTTQILIHGQYYINIAILITPLGKNETLVWIIDTPENLPLCNARKYRNIRKHVLN